MILRKLPDWRTRLDAYLQSIVDEPFDWPTHNCAGFVSHCLAAQAGVDPWADLRARFAACDGERGVKALLAQDYGGLEELFDAELMPFGFTRNACAAAGVPVITVSGDGKIAAGICLGRHIAALTEQGLLISIRLRVLAAWGWP